MQIEGLLSSISSGYFIRQVLTITGLSLSGCLMLFLAGGRLSVRQRMVCAFPAGLSAYALISFALLVTGIPFSRVTVLTAGVLLTTGLFFFRKKGEAFQKPDRLFLFFLLTVFVFAMICCSGLFSVSLDNDSFYFYSAYPQILVKEGILKYQMDMYLTNVGPVAAVIQTLPYLFGFSGTFGIQHFLNLNFLLLFAGAVFEKTWEGIGKKQAMTVSILVTVFLGTSPAFLTTAKWIMAGDYFMILFFLLLLEGSRSGEDASGLGRDEIFLLASFTTVLTMMRQEGALFVLLLIMIFSLMTYSGRQLVLVFLLPSILSTGLYYLRIYVFVGIRPEETFLTPRKAVLIVGAQAAAGVYLLLLRPFIKRILREYEVLLIPCGLAALNVVLFLLNPGRYLGNLRSLLLNVYLRNGWGMFGFLFAAALVCVSVKALLQKDKRISPEDSAAVSYLLAVLAAGWARGSDLQIGVGDSGNRLLLTAVPILVYSVILRLCRVKNEESVEASWEITGENGGTKA